MQICSFLPAATEILYALGLGDSVAGVTFECDYPPEARKKPVVLETVLKHSLTSAEVDQAVHEFSSHGDSLYRVQTELLRTINPDLIVTQELCDVCAVDKSQVAKALHELPSAPKIVSLTPHTLEDVWRDIEAVGDATNRREQARQLVTELRQRVDRVRQHSYKDRPRVLSLEWLSPPFNGGHWIPEMVELAGGTDPLGKVGEFSVEFSWEKIIATDPDIVLVMPCGYDLERAMREYRETRFPSEWQQLKAVRSGNVFAVHANAYFSRPGPRLVAGLEIMATLFHPDRNFETPPKSWARL
jgi:iron complex transport system substrate-binding protein